MRAAGKIAIAVGLGLAATSCGSSGTSTATTAPPTAATTTAPAPSTTTAVTTTSVGTSTTTPGALSSKLLQVGDVGSGWQVGSKINEMDLAAFPQVPCSSSTLDPAITQRLAATTGIQFEPSDGSYKHLIELVVSAPAAQLEPDLTALFDALHACVNVTSTDPSTSGVPSAPPDSSNPLVRELTIPALGDQRTAFVGWVGVSPESTTTWYGRSAIVRVGSVAVGLGLTEILDSPQAVPSISDADFVRMLGTAVSRLSG